MSANDNREQGKLFELRFKKQAQIQGLLAIKQDLSAKYIGGGGIRAFKSDLDFKLIDRRGNCGFFDCKSFEGNSFSYSMIDPKQLERALMYNDWNVASGFVVWLRGCNQVVFFAGRRITLKGPRNSFCASDGVLLGRIERFNLRAIMPLYMVDMREEEMALRPG